MKITFVTFHNWETKRIGGFHRLAEAAVKAGHEVVFFSFARPYYIRFKDEERLNKQVFHTLTKGKIYHLDNHSHLLNVTWPTLRLPQPLYSWVSKKINHWLNTHSLIPFAEFNAKYLSGTDVFVFESCAGEEIFDIVKRHNPSSRYVYRPSDPRMIDGASEDIKTLETHIMLNSDIVFIVNKAGLDLYRRKIRCFDEKINAILLPNGVDTSDFKKKYSCPPALNKPNTALYVGARVIEWDMIVLAAERCHDINFIIVCPEIPPVEFQKATMTLSNLQYIQGISPQKVAQWITNCDVYIVPNPKGWYKIKPWGITAKYYQAMAAERYIVAYEDTDELEQYGVSVAHSYDEFINYMQNAIKHKGKRAYEFSGSDWKTITDKFLNQISALCLQN